MNPTRFHDIVFIMRTGALVSRLSNVFPSRTAKRTRYRSDCAVFIQGDLDGAAGLRFMGVLDAEHNYRPKIF